MVFLRSFWNLAVIFPLVSAAPFFRTNSKTFWYIINVKLHLLLGSYSYVICLLSDLGLLIPQNAFFLGGGLYSMCDLQDLEFLYMFGYLITYLVLFFRGQ